jgi:hypothetical protein
MKLLGSRVACLAAVSILAVVGVSGLLGRVGRATAAGSSSMGQIVLAWGVGGVLTQDGTLWQFRPDTGAWVTVDDAFDKEGRKTHVLPLPVPVGEIADMESFGFLVTRSGNCWLYDLEKDSWREIGPPPRRQ